MLRVRNYGIREPGLHTVLSGHDPPDDRPVVALDLDLPGGVAQWKLFELHVQTRQPHWVPASLADVKRALHGRSDQELASLWQARDGLKALVAALIPAMTPSAARTLQAMLTDL